MNKRVRRTIEYYGPEEQVDYLLARGIGPDGFTAGHVRITEINIENVVPAGDDPVPYVRDSQYGNALKHN